MAKQVKLALHAINRKEEERNGLNKELIEAGEAIEALKKQVQELASDAEKKQKAMKELQSTIRGKAQLEQQGPLSNE
jgi:peptidoglycan hydrolase CwlO-like protein